MKSGLSDRVTITMDKKTQQKIRERQAKMIRVSNKSVSFSEVVNKILKDALK